MYYGFTLDIRLSVRPSFRFSFPDDILSKPQWIFTKLSMCIDIMEFGIAKGKFRQIFTELSARDTPIFSFPDDNLVNNKGFSSNLKGVVGWCEGAVYPTSLGRPTDIGLQLGKACYPCSG